MGLEYIIGFIVSVVVLVLLALCAALAREVLTESRNRSRDAKQTEKYCISKKAGDVMTVNGWIQILLYMAL